eukprot:symbB.v1.2.035595.t1/scaffold4835.1/size34096/2
MFTCCCERTDNAVVEVVGGVPLTMSEAHENTETKLQGSAEEETEERGLSFTFELPNKTTKEVRFLARPLGLDFSRSIPMHVKAVKQDSLAAAAQIQPKWVITHVQRTPIPSEFTDAMHHIYNQVQKLPEKKM